MPEWIEEGKFDSISIYHPALSFVSIVYGRVLLESGQYARYLGEADQLLADAREFPNLLTEIYLHIYSAVGYKKMGMNSEAEDSLQLALHLACEDGIICRLSKMPKRFFPC